MPDKKNSFLRFKELLKLEKSDISALYFYAIVSGILSLSLPLGIQSVIHFIQSGEITTSWTILVILVIAGVILTGVLQIMQLRITENIQQRIFIHYSFNFAHLFPRINRSAIKEKIPSELMNRFFDVITLQKGFSKVLLDFTSALLQIVFSLLVLSLYHPFYIAFSFLLVLILVVIFRPILKQGLDTSLKESKHKYATAYWLQEIARANWSFRLTPRETLSLSKLDKHTSAYLSSREDHFKILWRQFIWMIVIKALIVASLLGLGGYLVISQQINLGQFVAAEVLILLLLGAVEKIIQSLETFYDVCTSLEKLEQVKDLPLTFGEHHELSNSSIFPVELMQLNSSGNRVILHFDQHENSQLIGTNQVTASHLLKLLIDPTVDREYTPRWNFQVPKQGEIIAGFDSIGWFDKGTRLVLGSLRENIELGRENIPVQDVIQVLDTVGLNSIYEHHVNGLNLTISVTGSELSEEEYERILLARALICRPELVLISFIGSTIQNRKQLITDLMTYSPTSTFIVANEEVIDSNWKTIEINSLSL